MIDKIEVFKQSSIKFNFDKKIYADPLEIDKYYNDADLIFITHDHYDHFSKEDIDKVIKDDTIIIAPMCMENLLKNFKNVFLVDVSQKYEVNDVVFETVPSYNIDKKFHPKDKKYVGYIITLNGNRYYIAGDTDNVLEIRNVKCDVCFVPIGGTFTMNYKEAYELVMIIKPKIVVPIHYGSIVGKKEDGESFKKLFINTDIECILLLK